MGDRVMRMGWGKPFVLSSLVVFGLSMAFSFEASSQTSNPNLIGGGTNPESGAATAAFLPRTFILSQDPFAGSTFETCAAGIQAQEIQEATIARLQNFDAKTETTNALGSMLGGMLGGGGAGAGLQNGFVQGGTCENQELVPVTKATDCDSYKTGDSFKESEVNTAISELKAADSLASCKISSANRSEKLMGCFDQEIRQIKKAFKEVKKDFDTQLRSFARYENDVKAAIQKEDQKIQTLDGKVADFDKQVTEIETLLRKINGESGGPGGGTITGLQQALAQHNERQIVIQRKERAQRANGIQACLNGAGASTSAIRTCPNANADLLTPKDCVLTLFHDSVLQQLSGGGNRFSNADRKKADVQTKIFAQRLQQMMNDFSGDDPRVSTSDGFKQKYGAELGSLGAAGQQIMNELANCSNEVNSDIDRSKGDPSSSIGADVAALQNEASTLSSQMGSMLFDLDVGIRNAGKSVFGRELNQLVDVFGCNTSTVTSNAARDANGNPIGTGTTTTQTVPLNRQLDCIKGMSGTLRAMLNGTVPPGATAPLQAPLNVTNSQGQPVRCQGLRDCLETAKSLAQDSRNRKTDLEGSGTFTDSRCPGGCPGLKKFRTDSNTQIRTAVQTAADLFQKRATVLQSQFERMKGLFSKAGINFPEKEEKDIDLDAMCPVDENAVCKLPPDFDKQLASLAGVPDVGAAEFTAVKTAAKESRREATTIQKDLRGNLEKLKNLIAVCKKKDKSEADKNKLAKRGDELDEMLSGCKKLAEVGQSPTANPLPSLDTKLADLDSDINAICTVETGSPPGDCGPLKRRRKAAHDDCRAVFIGSLGKAADSAFQECITLCKQDDVACKQSCVSDKKRAQSDANKVN